MNQAFPGHSYRPPPRKMPTALKVAIIVIGSLFVLVGCMATIGAIASHDQGPAPTKPAVVEPIAQPPATVIPENHGPSVAAPGAEYGEDNVLLIEVTAAVRSNVSWSVGLGGGSGDDIIPAGKKWTKEIRTKNLPIVSATISPVNYELGGDANECKITVNGVKVAEKANGIWLGCRSKGEGSGS